MLVSKKEEGSTIGRPLVSIGIPNYNYARYIEQTLDSVLRQAYRPLEVIIVDDQSADHSIETIEKWISQHSGDLKIILIKNEKNLGLPGTCNVILNNANGKYFQVLDADDIILPGKIMRQVAMLEENTAIAMVYSDMHLMDHEGQVTHQSYLEHIGYNNKEMPQGDIFGSLFKFNFVPLPTVLVKTEVAKQYGGFDASLQVQDYYLWLKIAKEYPVLYQPGATASYRIHPLSMSGNDNTNPASVDSVLQIKYRYYQELSPVLQSIVKRDIHYATTYLYGQKYPSAGKWLWKDVVLQHSVKSLVYFLALKAGLPFSFFKTFKK